MLLSFVQENSSLGCIAVFDDDDAFTSIWMCAHAWWHWTQSPLPLRRWFLKPIVTHSSLESTLCFLIWPVVNHFAWTPTLFNVLKANGHWLFNSLFCLQLPWDSWLLFNSRPSQFIEFCTRCQRLSKLQYMYMYHISTTYFEQLWGCIRTPPPLSLSLSSCFIRQLTKTRIIEEFSVFVRKSTHCTSHTQTYPGHNRNLNSSPKVSESATS